MIIKPLSLNLSFFRSFKLKPLALVGMVYASLISPSGAMMKNMSFVGGFDDGDGMKSVLLTPKQPNAQKGKILGGMWIHGADEYDPAQQSYFSMASNWLISKTFNWKRALVTTHDDGMFPTMPLKYLMPASEDEVSGFDGVGVNTFGFKGRIAQFVSRSYGGPEVKGWLRIVDIQFGHLLPADNSFQSLSDVMTYHTFMVALKREMERAERRNVDQGEIILDKKSAQKEADSKTEMMMWMESPELVTQIEGKTYGKLYLSVTFMRNKTLEFPKIDGYRFDPERYAQAEAQPFKAALRASETMVLVQDTPLDLDLVDGDGHVVDTLPDPKSNPGSPSSSLPRANFLNDERPVQSTSSQEFSPVSSTDDDDNDDFQSTASHFSDAKTTDVALVNANGDEE